MRLDPVKADFFRAWVARYDRREFVGDFANPHWLRTTHAILQRPANGWPQFKRRKTAHHAGKFLNQNRLEATAEPLACFKALGDNDRLGKEIVGELHVQRQIKSDGSLTDIGRPMVDFGIALQEFFEGCNDLLGCIDGGSLGKFQVDKQFRPVGRREKLLRNETQSKYRTCQCRQRHTYR